jgi:low affinity Fe/Cu permease
VSHCITESTTQPPRQPRFSRFGKSLEHFAIWTTNWVGSSWAFVAALVLVIAWIVTGPIFHFSDTWQLVMNTISSIVTFLMVFLIQRSQNKDTLAMQIKLNELLASQRGASDRLINVEDLSEEEVRDLHARYQALVKRAQQTDQLTEADSIEEIIAAPDSDACDRKQAAGAMPRDRRA